MKKPSSLISKRIKRLRILVIDDIAIFRDITSAILQHAPHTEIFTADSTSSALSILETTEIDIVTQDLMRPNGTGFEFLKVVKAKPGIRHIPVIIISGCGSIGFNRA